MQTQNRNGHDSPKIALNRGRVCWQRQRWQKAAVSTVAAERRSAGPLAWRWMGDWAPWVADLSRVRGAAMSRRGSCVLVSWRRRKAACGRRQAWQCHFPCARAMVGQSLNIYLRRHCCRCTSWCNSGFGLNVEEGKEKRKRGKRREKVQRQRLARSCVWVYAIGKRKSLPNSISACAHPLRAPWKGKRRAWNLAVLGREGRWGSAGGFLGGCCRTLPPV